MRVTLPFLFEYDERSKYGTVREVSLRSSVEVEIPEIEIGDVTLAFWYRIGAMGVQRFKVRGSPAAVLTSVEGAALSASELQGQIERSLHSRTEEFYHPDFPAPPYLRAPRWDRYTSVNFVPRTPPAQRRAVVEDLHDRRYQQARAFFERTFTIVDGTVWAAVREPALSLRLWPRRAGVNLISRPVVDAAYKQFSLTRVSELTEFVQGPLNRQCAPLPIFHVVDGNTFKRCDLVELAWDTLRIWGHPELDREALLDGPPEPGTLDARLLIRSAHERLMTAASAEMAEKTAVSPMTAKFTQRWEFELSLPYAQQLMSVDEVPFATTEDAPQEVLDELAVLSI